MPDDDFEVVRRAWAAASRADPDAMLREYHPEIVAVPFGAAMEGKAYRGPSEVLRWWRDEIQVTWEFFEVLPETFRRVGDKILVTGRWKARGRESGRRARYCGELDRGGARRQESSTGRPTPTTPRPEATPASRADAREAPIRVSAAYAVTVRGASRRTATIAPPSAISTRLISCGWVSPATTSSFRRMNSTRKRSPPVSIR